MTVLLWCTCILCTLTIKLSHNNFLTWSWRSAVIIAKEVCTRNTVGSLETIQPRLDGILLLKLHIKQHRTDWVVLGTSVVVWTPSCNLLPAWNSSNTWDSWIYKKFIWNLIFFFIMAKPLSRKSIFSSCLLYLVWISMKLSWGNTLGISKLSLSFTWKNKKVTNMVT